MNEQQAIAWLESLNQKYIDTKAAQNGEYDVWSSIWSEMRSALEAILPPGHFVLRQWQQVVDQARREKTARLQVVENFVGAELIGLCRTAISLLKNNQLRSLADGVRAETIAHCLDQADTLARAGYSAAAMVLAVGGLETHLRNLCLRVGATWQGNGSIAAYKQALDQARNNGTQNTV
jgi:hypothetical protein